MAKITGIVIPGHGVASGIGEDLRYPEGTLILQIPYFAKQGLDLTPYFRGTINLDIGPFSYTIGKPKYFFKAIDWSEYIPPENFYFFEVSAIHNSKSYQGYVYMPDPATKRDHIQDENTLELILPKIGGLQEGDQVFLEVPEGQLTFKNKRI